MKRIKRFLPAALLVISLLAGCGASGNAHVSSSAADMGGGEWAETTAAPMEDALSTGNGGSATRQSQDEKLIYTAELQMETTVFDQTTAAIQTLAASCGGYFESSSVSNWGSGYRSADYTVRVPAEQYQTFLDQAGQLCHVLNKQEYTENITEAYYDVDGRLKTQQTKLDRLQTLLARAETMEDIITIESAISDTEAQIESLSGQLQHYDALVAYSTVRLSLSEVYKLSNVEEPVTGFSSRLGTAFTSGLRNFQDGLENFAVWLAYSWMWLAAIAVIVVTVIRHLRKRRKAPSFPPVKKTDDKPE